MEKQKLHAKIVLLARSVTAPVVCVPLVLLVRKESMRVLCALLPPIVDVPLVLLVQKESMSLVCALIALIFSVRIVLLLVEQKSTRV
jgi:hypothetical protein